MSQAVRVPKYYEVRDRIAALIADAPAGTPVPTERDLAVRFETSRTTVRQALAALTADGRLDRTQGRGTFVAEPQLVEVRQLTSYSDDLRQQGQAPTSTVLDISVVRAEAAVAAKLGLEPGARVTRVERLRGVADEPLAHETAYLAGTFPRLRRELQTSGSLYRTLADVYGVRLGRVEDQVRTIQADPHEAQLLETEIGLPLLLIQRTGWDADGVPVEFTRSAFRGDRFSFVASSAVG